MEDGGKLFGKSRWRGKLFSKDDEPGKTTARPLNNDVMDFLAPSTQKAQAIAQKPKIDISAAKRWPDASDIKNAPSPVVNSALRGAKISKRGKALTVTFVRSAPDVIGEGGDMAEDPVIIVSQMKTAHAPRKITQQDDAAMNLNFYPTAGIHGRPGARSPNALSERPQMRARADTSHGEVSQPLYQKLEKRKSPPLPPQGPQAGEGFGFRPKPLARAPTGFNTIEEPAPPPFKTDEEDDFVPKPLKRAQTGFSASGEYPSSDEEPKLPNVDFEDPHIDKLNRQKRTFSAQMRQKMVEEEAQAFHKALLTQRDSDENERPQTASDDSSSPPQALQPPGPPPNRTLPQPRPVVATGNGFKPYVPNKPQVLSPEEISPNVTGKFSQDRGSPYQPQPSPRLRSPTNVAPSHDTQPRQRTGRSPVPAGPRESPKPYKPSPEPNSVRQPTQSPIPGSQPRDLPPYSQSAPEKPVSRLNQEASIDRSRRPRADTAVSATPSAGDAALEDFAERVTHMRSIFRLTAELERALYDHSPTTYSRAAIWWFLKGRTGLEDMIRNSQRDGPAPQERLMQPHVDLAKTWWIITDVMGSHPALRNYHDISPQAQSKAARDASDKAAAEIFELIEMVSTNLKALVSSMSRNGVMPPQQALIQGQDQSIWIKYPKFHSDVAPLLVGKSSRSLLAEESSSNANPMSTMPLSDTRDEFCYGRMFVRVSLSTDDADTDRVDLPCVLTILRPRDDWRLKVAICSQSELVNIIVQGDRKAGPTWEDVQWRTKARGLTVHLPRGYALNVDFQEKDFRTLYNIYDYTARIERSLAPEPEIEKISYELTLRDFQYTNTANPQAFPQDRVRRCRVKIFERQDHVAHGTGLRRFHRGYRFVVCSSPRNKTLNSVCHTLGISAPVDFEFRQDSNGQDSLPALQLRCIDAKSKTTMVLGFNNTKERSALFAALTGMNPDKEETVFAQMPLQSLTIEPTAVSGVSSSVGAVTKNFKWTDVKVINADPEVTNTDIPKTVMSEYLRVVARHNAGSWTDWMNLAPGQMQIRLDTTKSPRLLMKREPQLDVTASIDAKRAESSAPEALNQLVQVIEKASTIRVFEFQNMQDLHNFESAVTGFSIRFDGVASTVHIARRRMVVPIYKKWEANQVRVQIVERENMCQVVFFFDNFSHAEAMNFQIKQMDVFEKIDKGKGFSGGSNWGLKLADAKFALPGGKGEGREGKGEKNRFLSLDLLEYAGEHDDITIGFDSQEERDRFSRALPAATQVVRSMTMRRKI
ncbi:hypothetical protein EJ05DRAFT_503558 [Pseudovirgaria hyperparasitica]|uniref:Uncharacterized protein n=1 Tax=Pseudovirgaria hyperparasitica TaxID=470096 RepID=A0A6A6VYG5_9PEZI|nr:uncharacterized protein EJ05DRAFT_503558 [Pseudovirgaria hyperparasitica]KAF2755255.1 hypothetical protein EJ05DRAFT_503558 [Pseudovirgaria hyperparasitica]